MSETLCFHPFANLIPSMSDEEYQGLKADIAEHGQHEAIVLYEGQILDGRHRHRACCELGLVPKFREWEGSGSAIDLVVSENLHRRHLTPGQRAVIAVEAVNLQQLQMQARERSVANLRRGDTLPDGNLVAPREQGRTRDQVAAQYSTNSRYVQDAQIISNAKPELLEQVKDGQITLPQAKQSLLREQKLAELQRKAEAARSTADGPPLWKIHHGDCLEVLPTLAGSARVIFADPPYNLGIDYGAGADADNLPPDQYLAWCRGWIQQCADCLTPDGSFWILISDEWADYFGVMLREAGLHRRAWIKWYETFGTNCVNNFNRCSRHIHYFVKNPRCFVFDPFAVSRLSDRQTKYGDKRANPGGKIWDDVWKIARLTGTCEERMPGFPTQVPLAITGAIVKCASEPGDLVVDPFSGSASTGVAAVQGKRRYVGIEASAEFCRLSELRLQALGQA